MNGDESRGNYNNFQQRRQPQYKTSYSPNSNFYGNAGFNGQQHQQHAQHGAPHPQQKRRPPFKNNFSNNNSNDKLIKQNDQIIKLLKEIRDRLPAPPASANAAQNDDNDTHVNQHHDEPVSAIVDNDEEIGDEIVNEEEHGYQEENEADSFEANEHN